MMGYFCHHCKESVNGEESDDPLLPPAMICEFCGTELEEPSESYEDEFEFEGDGLSPLK